MATEAVEDERVLFEEAAPEPSTAAQVVGEIVGSFILATLGLGIGAAAFAAANQGVVKDVTWFGDIWPTSFGWALCIALGIYCTATLSGAHFNPAVTLALAATGRHPWSQVPRYIACQIWAGSSAPPSSSRCGAATSSGSPRRRGFSTASRGARRSGRC
jgi:hypothetical protein